MKLYINTFNNNIKAFLISSNNNILQSILFNYPIYITDNLIYNNNKIYERLMIQNSEWNSEWEYASKLYNMLPHKMFISRSKKILDYSFYKMISNIKNILKLAEKKTQRNRILVFLLNYYMVPPTEEKISNIESINVELEQ
jgi:hypothetical protein